MSECMHFFEHHRGSHRRQPSRCLLNSIAPFLESLHPYLNHHFFEHHGPSIPPLRFRFSTKIKLHPYLNHHFFDHYRGGCRPPQPPRYFLDSLQRFTCTPIRIITSAKPPPPQPLRYLFFLFSFMGIEMPFYLNHDPVNSPATF